MHKVDLPYRELFESNPQPMWVYDLDSLQVLMVNAAALHQYGYSREEFLGLTIDRLRPPEDAAALHDVLEHMAGSFHPASVWRHQRKDGQVLLVEINSHAVAYPGRRARLVMAYDVTARVEAQMELRRTEALLRAASRVGRFGAWLLDLDTGRFECSDEVCTIHGVPGGLAPTVDEAIACYAPQWRNRFKAVLQACATDGAAFDEEMQIASSGQTIWVRVIGEPVRDASGRIVAVQGALQDITERRDSDAWNEQKYRQLFDVIPAPIWSARPDGTLDYLSKQLYDYLGLTPERLPPREWLTTVHPDDRQRASAAWQAALDAARPYACEMRLRRADGEYCWHLDAGTPLLDEHGRVVKYYGTLSNIHRIKMAEASLAQRELALRERLKELGCVYRTLALASAHERPLAELCREIADVVPPGMLHDDIAVARIEIDAEQYRSSRWQTPVVAIEVPIRSAGTESGRVQVGYLERRGTGEAFLDEEREMLAAVATHIGHMLDRRAMAARLARSERLSAVGELTGGIAHDFNNLLTVVLGNAELLSERLRGDPELGPLADMTRIAAERGADLTGRLLAFARRQPLDPQTTDVNRLLASMADLLRRTLGEQIEIEFAADDALWAAMVDAPQLENAILNLCLNARDAMPEGGHLTIETRNSELDDSYASRHDELMPGQYVMIGVSDTGIGMDALTVERAFEPFFSTKDVGQGSGLGLSMVYGFIKQSRGHVRIYSEPGDGTTVRLYLPRSSTNADVQITSSPASAAQAAGEKILLVEDDDIVREHVLRQLQSLGYEVVPARNGPHAMAILEQTAGFDLLFTDVVMSGGMSGRELADAARKLHPDLPVLFTSGYTENAIVHHGRLDPGVHLLAKPYRRQELAVKLREFFGDS